MDFNPEESAKLSEIEKFAKDRVRKDATKIDRLSKYPDNIIKEMVKRGLFGMYLPQEYGGSGFSLATLMEAIRIISRECASTSLILDVTVSLFAEPVLKYGNSFLKNKYLSRVSKGEIGALAITEPSTGSDAAAIKTTAKKEGKRYVIKGGKTFITNGNEARFFVVSAMTAPQKKHRGMTLFVVDREMNGLSVGNEFKKLGIRGTSTTEVLLDDVEVEEDQVVGGVEDGFRIEMETLNVGRIGIAAQAVGISEGTIRDVVRFSSEEIERPKENFQFGVADLTGRLHSSVRAFEDAIKFSESGDNSPLLSSISKLHAGDNAVEITSRASELLGYHAMTELYPIERRYREAKITQIYEGTNEVQRLVIAKEVLKNGLPGF